MCLRVGEGVWVYVMYGREIDIQIYWKPLERRMTKSWPERRHMKGGTARIRTGWQSNTRCAATYLAEETVPARTVTFRSRAEVVFSEWR